ncbi:MAG: hypothetical protein ACK5MR_16880 [Cumulibacter sp.]
MNSRTSTGLVAVAAIALLTGCSSSDSSEQPEPPATSSETEVAAAPQEDGRELSDWALQRFLAKDSTSICEVGTQNLQIEFGKEGWCENDVQFKETPVIVTLVATCDATANGGNTPPGTLYAYDVEPSISPTGDGTYGGLQVIVEDVNGTWQVSRVLPDWFDPTDPVIGSCPYKGVELLDESIPLE